MPGHCCCSIGDNAELWQQSLHPNVFVVVTFSGQQWTIFGACRARGVYESLEN